MMNMEDLYLKVNIQKEKGMETEKNTMKFLAN